MPESPSARGNPGYSNLVAVVALVLLFAFGVLPRLLRSSGSHLVGHEAPDFALDLVYNGDAGSRMRLSDLRGHTVILDFWASWCGPCQMEAPVLDRVARRNKDKGVIVLGINTSDEPGLAAAFARQKQLGYPIVYDDGNRVANEYGVDSLPTLIILNGKGEVTAVRSGVENDSELDRLVTQAM